MDATNAAVSPGAPDADGGRTAVAGPKEIISDVAICVRFDQASGQFKEEAVVGRPGVTGLPASDSHTGHTGHTGSYPGRAIDRQATPAHPVHHVTSR